MRQIENTFDRVIADHNVQIGLMNKILRLASERSLILQHMLLTDDPFEIDEQHMEMGGIVQDYLLAREELLLTTLTEEEKELLELQHVRSLRTGALQNSVVQMIMGEQYDEAKRLLYSEAIPAQEEAMAIMHDFISLQRRHNSQELERSQGQVESGGRILFFLMVFGLLVSVLIAIWVTTRLNREINRRNKIESELEERVEHRTKDIIHMATHDALTGLLNRTVFSEQLDSAIKLAIRHKKYFAVFFMDLDGFKAVNDSYGHAVGDTVLINVTQRLKSAIRESDVIARLGGDEFAVLVNELDSREGAESVAAKIIKEVNGPVLIDGHECKVGISIGIKFFGGEKITADTVMTKADDAMYVAKKFGKNRYVISSDV